MRNSHNNAKKSLRRNQQPTGKVITFDEVFQSGNPRYPIVEYPPKSGQRYALFCKSHTFPISRKRIANGTSLRYLQCASAHMQRKHQNLKAGHHNVIKFMGSFVKSCTQEQQDANNTIYDQSYDGVRYLNGKDSLSGPVSGEHQACFGGTVVENSNTVKKDRAQPSQVKFLHNPYSKKYPPSKTGRTDIRTSLAPPTSMAPAVSAARLYSTNHEIITREGYELAAYGGSDTMERCKGDLPYKSEIMSFANVQTAKMDGTPSPREVDIWSYFGRNGEGLCSTHKISI